MTLEKQRYQNKYMTIRYFDEEHNWPVRWMCQRLGVSRAGYYKWLDRVQPEQEKENEQIAAFIRYFDEEYQHTLGYRRMTGYISQKNGCHYNKKRIRRIMKKLGIHAVIRRSKAKYRRSTPEAVAENVLHRDFNAEKPNMKWVTDVTELKWYEGPVIHKLYLSAIIDLYDTSVISYVISARNDNPLVFETFDKAIDAYPDAKPLFHSDRGFQYTHKTFQNKLNEQGMTQSMSRVGCCIDNGPMEGFWGILKAEMFYLKKYTSEEELRRDIESFIAYYNNERLRERFGFRAPMQVRQAALSATEPVQYPIAFNSRIAKFKEKYAA